MNRSEAKKALEVARSNKASFKITKSLQKLSELGFGEVRGRDFYISYEQREHLRVWLRTQHDIDCTLGVSQLDGTRTDVSKFAVDGKLTNRQVSRDWIRLKNLKGKEAVEINGEKLLIPSGAHLEMSITDISNIKCDVIVLIENLETFKDSDLLNLPISFEQPVVIYRGDKQSSGIIRFAKLIKDINRVPAIWYGDFDPAGIEIALNSSLSPEYMVLPCLNDLSDIKGSLEDFRRQYRQFESLKSKELPGDLTPYVSFLGSKKESFTQERLLAKAADLTLIDITF